MTAAVMEPPPLTLPPAPAAAEAPVTKQIFFHRPQLYPKQLAAIYDPARICVIEAATKTGKTTGCIVWLLEKAYQGRPGWQFWWVAPTMGVARIAYRRLKAALARDTYRANETQLYIHLLYVDTTIVFKGADEPDSLYGDDVYAAVIDEATRMKEDSWHAVRTTLTATRGPVRIIGNKKGRRNWAYRLARKAQAGEPGMAWHKLTGRDAIEAGIFDQAEYDAARRELPPAVFAQLYDADDGDDEGNPFGEAAIAACITAAMSSKPPVLWGWDLAKRADWTVGIGLDEDGVLAGFERLQLCPWPEITATILRRTAGAQALVDSTGAGDPVLDQLQLEGSGNFEGFVFTDRSKQQLMVGLAADLQARHLRYTDGPVSLELQSFEFKLTRTGVRYSAPDGMHDDCVCALALAAELRRRGAGTQVGGLGIVDRAKLELARTPQVDMAPGRVYRGRGSPI